MMGVKIEALLAVASGRKYPAFGANEHLFIQNGGHLQRHSIHLCSIGLYFSNHIVDVRLELQSKISSLVLFGVIPRTLPRWCVPREPIKFQIGSILRLASR